MRTLTDEEVAALVSIDQIGGDFDDGGASDLEVGLAERGLVAYVAGPYTARCRIALDDDGPCDPIVSERGRMALRCWRLGGGAA